MKIAQKIAGMSQVRPFLVGIGFATLFGFAGISANAQVAVSQDGAPSYSLPIAVPPGIAGMAPNLGLLYSGSNVVNGPVGYGWTVQGISSITRCPGNQLIDGTVQGVNFNGNDKLCLDGQRLIQTDANGVVVNGSVSNPGTANPFQTGDSQGGSGMVREYRTERDMYSRIRAYGTAGSDPANGPAYFRVWTKSGQMFEYGVNANATANAQIVAQGKTVVVAWPVSRISDTVGNYIDFQYEQRDVAWGSTLVGGATAGHEWNLLEIRYTGTAGQVANNKVVFSYVDRADNAGAKDRSEAYQNGSKNVSIRLLQAIRTYVSWPANQTTMPAGAVKVKTTKLTYDHGPNSGRSRLTSVMECAGAAESSCMPPSTFSYTAGGDAGYTANPVFSTSGMATLVMQSAPGNYGVLTGNFFGTGRLGILRWSDTASANELFQSVGDGTFTQIPAGTGAGQFNITDQNLFKSDGCYNSIVADFNGDGLSDILRVMNTSSLLNANCGTVRNILYTSNGDGSFRSTDVTGIDLSTVPQVRTDQYSCGGIPDVVGEPASGATKGATSNGAAALSPGITPSYTCIQKIYVGTSGTPGKMFHVLDVNNDGLLDIVTTIIPSFVTSLPAPTDDVLCASTVCTHVYLGQSGGGFVEQATNLANRSVYATPLKYAKALQWPYVVDVNGDGLTDLVVDSGVWLSNGNGNFITAPPGSFGSACAYAGDFNGDGRSDCIFPGLTASSQHLNIADGTVPMKSASNFNLTSQQLLTQNSLSLIQTGGIQIADVDGDGRADIIAWQDDPTLNAVYLSNGDGTFRKATSFTLNNANSQLQKNDNTASFVLGDFTGHGNTEILRMVASPTAGAPATINQLYVKNVTAPPDQLVSVTSGTGLTTTLTMVPLSNSASGGLGSRYTNDYGTPNAASYPVFDITTPMYVVATSVADTGTGTTLPTEYSYAGLKAAHDGRGWLSFRETRHQSVAPDAASSPMTVMTQNLQTGYYIGMASQSQTWNGPLNSSSPSVLSTTTYVYCDNTSAAAASSATVAAPCPTTARVQRPYLYQSVESGTDLQGVVLPTVTTTNTYNTSGDPLTITATTSGTASSLGLAQTFTKATTNTYFADNTSGDNWILGRLQTASVLNTVPNSLGSIATSAGSAPLAQATQGVPVTVAISPTQLTVNAAVGAASGTVTALASGGSGTYTYSWTRTTGTRTTASSSSLASTAINATLVAGDNFTDVWTVTATDVLGGSATASVNTTFVVAATTLTLSNCAGTTPTTAPAAATWHCTVSNSGSVAASSISYSAPAGMTFYSTPTGACAANSVCGTVGVQTGTSAGNYSGILTVTPNAGTAASTNVTLTVNPPSLTPPALAITGCSGTTPTTTPTAATWQCTVSNTGQTAAGSLSFTPPNGMTLTSSPTGACAASSVCGTVAVTTGTAAGTYSGTLTVTPNTGTGASTSVTLTVNPRPLTPPALAITGCSGTTPTTAPTPATWLCTVSNTGQTAASSLSYTAPAGMTFYSGSTGPCAANSVCGTVGVQTGTSAGNYSGTLTITPNIGTGASTNVSLTVNPGSTSISINPSTGLNFGTVRNVSAKLTATITNTGIAATPGIAASVSGSGQPGSFSLSAGTTCSAGTPLGVGQSCTITVEYDLNCTPGTVYGVLTVSGTNFTTVTSNLTAVTSTTGLSCNIAPVTPSGP